MKNKGKIYVYLLIFVLVFSLVGCKSNNTQTINNTDGNVENSAENSAEKKILRYSLRADTPTLDPQMANAVPTATIGAQIFEGLVRSYGGEILPGIAEKWEISEDGLTYTFHLRDAKWSDGKPVTAKDFEYGMKRLMNPETGSPYSFLGYVIKNAAKVNSRELALDEMGVKAKDDKTLIIELENPTEYFLSMLHMMQLYSAREDIVNKYGKDFAADADKNVYNGPFVLKEWKHEDRLILEKNPDYWNADAIKLDGVQIIVVPEAMTAVAMFEEGSLDFVNVPSELLPQYKDKATYYFNGADDFLKLNMDGTCLLDNKNLRLAINYGINRRDYVDITTQGMYEPGTRYVLPDVSGVNGKYGDEYPLVAFPEKGDIQRSKEYLNEAMKELKINNPAEIEIELLTTDQEKSRIQAEVIQDQLQTNLGIKINIKQVPYKQRLQMEAEHKFQMVFSGWCPDYSDPMTYLELWTTSSPYNHGSYSNNKYDELINFARTSTEKAKRMDALFEAEKTILEDGAIVPMQLRREAYIMNPKLIGFKTYFVGVNYDYIYAGFTD